LTAAAVTRLQTKTKSSNDGTGGRSDQPEDRADGDRNDSKQQQQGSDGTDGTQQDRQPDRETVSGGRDSAETDDSGHTDEQEGEGQTAGKGDLASLTREGDSAISGDETGDALETAERDLLAMQQSECETLKKWMLAAKNKQGNLFIRNKLLYRRDKVCGVEVEQVCLPLCRRSKVLQLAHGTCHLATKRTADRIRYNFAWPSQTADITDYCAKCDACQKRARVTYRDRVPIEAIPRSELAWDHWWVDIAGPIFPNLGDGRHTKPEYNYFLVMVDSCTRWPAAYALKSTDSKHVCDAFIQQFQITGTPTWISSDNATNFGSKLTQELLKRLGVSPKFATPYHSNASGLVERAIGTIKNSISKLAENNPRSWHKSLGFALWALRESRNATTGMPPWLLAFGFIPRGPLAILKETWSGERKLPPNVNKSADDYLLDLQSKLEAARDLADENTATAQDEYVEHYNRKSRDKQFKVGDSVLILVPDSTSSKLFARWQGPAKIVKVMSPYSYLVEFNGSTKHLHANRLRKYVSSTVEATCSSVMFCFEGQADVKTCAIINERDEDFGPVHFLDGDTENSGRPSEKIKAESVAHLSATQRAELLDLVDRYADCFSDKPGFTTAAEHHIKLKPGFKPTRLHSYKVPDRLKPEVSKQIDEMLKLGIIKESNSPMASPLVCILKGPNGQDGVRLVCDFRFLNKFTVADEFPMRDISSILQRIGGSRYITKFDVKSAYWQTAVREEDRWLTAFVCDRGQFEWTRTPFGARNAGASFNRAVQKVLEPVRTFTDAYVDDMCVFSDGWAQHLREMKLYLREIRKSGLTLSLSKCEWAKPEIKFCGQIVGSGQRRADPDKVAAVARMEEPQTKKQVRQAIGFFSYFREFIPDFSAIAIPLTDLTAKSATNRVQMTATARYAFERLKTELCKAVFQSLQIVSHEKPFNLYVDASDYAVAGILTQTDAERRDRPIAFYSSKLTPTQRNWATVEKEAYAALTALQKFRMWIFGAPVTVYSDHNPLTYCQCRQLFK